MLALFVIRRNTNRPMALILGLMNFFTFFLDKFHKLLTMLYLDNMGTMSMKKWNNEKEEPILQRADVSTPW